MSLKGRDLITLQDFTRDEIKLLIDLAREYKLLSKSNAVPKALKDKSIAMLFALPSTRTRVSFEVAAFRLGALPIYMRPGELQLSRGEDISDTAHVLSRYVDAIVARLLKHDQLLELASYSEVPVINALTNLYHPCQALADLMTILEKKGAVKGVKVAYVGDGYNNVCHSLLIACSKMGINISIATPRGYEPDPDIVNDAMENAHRSSSKIELHDSPSEAIKDADVIYTDVFISMGREAEKEKRLRDFKGWQVTKELTKLAKPDFIFMHCLPAHRGEEVAPEVIDDPLHSVVWDQAENRLYTEMAILALLVP